MSLAVSIRIIRTLPLEKALKFAERGGPALLGLMQYLNQRREGRALKQKELTLQEVRDALPQLLGSIQSREIRLISNAFNSTPTFLAYFEAAALGSIPLILLDLSSAIKKVGASLDAIKSELAIANVARVQGWDQGGFGSYVHRFVKNEMATAHMTQDDQYHFFYVWHPDSDWYPAFEERQAQDPLGPAFGGYHHDLATICVRMRADREALIVMTDYGHTALLHLVIPAYYPLVLDRPIAFADELLPLTITGGRHRGTDLVWSDLRQDSDEDELLLNFISLLPPKGWSMATKASAVGYAGSWVVWVGCGFVMTTFPPIAPAAAVAYNIFGASTMAFWTGMAASDTYHNYMQEAVHVLGDPIFLGELSDEQRIR